MTNLWLDLVPLIIGGGVVPIQIIVVILLLRSKGGILSAVAFVCGMTTLRLLQGLFFGFIFNAGNEGQASSGPSPAASAFLVVLGIILLVTAVRQFLKDDDPDAPPPKWMRLFESMTAGMAFLVGMGLLTLGAKFWVLTLSAIHAIKDAALGVVSATINFLLFVLFSESLLLLPIIACLIAPKAVDTWLMTAHAWLTKYNRVIVIVFSTVFGLLLLYKGLSGLAL